MLIPGIADQYCLRMFLNRLKDEIRLGIRSRDAQDLFNTIHLAHEIERELAAVRGIGRGQAAMTFKPGVSGGSAGYFLREESEMHQSISGSPSPPVWPKQ